MPDLRREEAGKNATTDLPLQSQLMGSLALVLVLSGIAGIIGYVTFDARGLRSSVEAKAGVYATNLAAQTTQLNASNQRIAENQSNSAAAAAVSRDLEASRAERCEKAKAFYQNAINSQRLYRTKPDGTREYLNDQELAQARVDALKDRNAICGTTG